MTITLNISSVIYYININTLHLQWSAIIFESVLHWFSLLSSCIHISLKSTHTSKPETEITLQALSVLHTKSLHPNASCSPLPQLLPYHVSRDCCGSLSTHLPPLACSYSNLPRRQSAFSTPIWESSYLTDKTSNDSLLSKENKIYSSYYAIQQL